MPAEWEGAFDRVVSVEMVEAVGREYMEVGVCCVRVLGVDETELIACVHWTRCWRLSQTYWSKIDWALNKETGVGVVQGITIPEASGYSVFVGSASASGLLIGCDLMCRV